MTRKENIQHALLWVKQWLTLLHPKGFPATLEIIDGALRGKMDADEAIREIVKATRHLAHPSLTNLREIAQ